MLAKAVFFGIVLLFVCQDILAWRSWRRCPYQNNKWCHKQLASLVYHNGYIYTADPSDPEWSKHPHEAMAIEYGEIVYVGSNEGVENFIYGNTEIVNLGKFTVMPGLHDVHQHPLESGSSVGGTCTLPWGEAPDSPKMKQALEECSGKTQLGTDWVLGHGHAIFPILEYINNTNNPDPKTLLDGYFVDPHTGKELPAVMMEETSHSVWANSEALRRAGIHADSEGVTGGIFLKNSVGEPNGILLENAGNYIMDFAMNSTLYPDLEYYAWEGLQWSLGKLARNGITSVCDARVYWGRKNDQAWLKLEKENKLTVRAVLGLWGYPHLDDKDQFDQLRDRFTNNPSKLLRTSQIKLYMDGILDQLTAALLEPYNVTSPIIEESGLIPGNTGMNYFTQERLTKWIQELQDLDGNGNGFDFHIHAIGDRAVREALNAIEASKKELQDHRHRLTHLELVDKQDLNRFKQLGVIADMQVAGMWTLPDDPVHERYVEILGDYRASRTIPTRELMQADAVVTLSSDWDVSPVNPFVGMYHATIRGAQSVSLQQSVEMYTRNAAFAMRQLDKTGTLEVGKRADLVVINQDIFKLPQSQMDKVKDTVVYQTLVDGKEIFRHNNFD